MGTSTSTSKKAHAGRARRIFRRAVIGLLVLDSLLGVGLMVYKTLDAAGNRPIKGLVQGIKLVLILIGGVLVVAVVLGKNPAVIFGGIGALPEVPYGAEYTDLGPFRAIRWDTLQHLQMCDRNYGWTVEMQIKAARRGIAHCEVPVSYRRRIGSSKVSGTIRGSVGAGAKILWLLGRYAWS